MAEKSAAIEVDIDNVGGSSEVQVPPVFPAISAEGVAGPGWLGQGASAQATSKAIGQSTRVRRRASWRTHGLLQNQAEQARYPLSVGRRRR